MKHFIENNFNQKVFKYLVFEKKVLLLYEKFEKNSIPKTN